jgi:hypothetical protein
MTAPSWHRWKAGLLGLFVTWQLVYLPAANLFQFFPLRVRADSGDLPLSLQQVGRFTDDDGLQSFADAAGAGLTRYAELSGQIQGWRLFTPELPPTTIVLIGRFEWADGRSAEFVSPVAPPESPVIFRLPRRDLRAFHFEACLGLGPWAVSPHLLTRDPDAVSSLTLGWAAERPRSVRTTMRDYWTRYRSEYPIESEPCSITLITRQIAKPVLGVRESQKPVVTDRPFVRWTDPFGPSERLDAFDPVRGVFVRVAEDRP